MSVTAPKYPNIEVQLTGESDHPISIVMRTKGELRRGHIDENSIAEYQKEALSGDYDHVIQTTMHWVTVS